MNKKLIILPLMVLMLFAMAGLVNAACTFVSPVTDGTITGDYVFNVSCAEAASGSTNRWNETFANCTVSASSSRTGDSETFVVNANFTATINHSNATVATSGVFANAEDWALSGTCSNSSSDTVTLTEITGVDLDNSNPVALSLTALGERDDTSATVTASVANATSWQCYNKGNVVASGDITYSFTGTSVSCRLALSAGNNTYNITGFDGISYSGNLDTYNMISGGMYDSSTGGLVTDGAMTPTVIGTGEKPAVMQKMASAWQRFVAWLMNLFRIG